jgi:hypothetical protein
MTAREEYLEALEYYKSTPQYNCHRLVANAIRTKKLIRPTHCENCQKECVPVAHHDDYSYPFLIKWLCNGCHSDTHIHCGGRPLGSRNLFHK